MRGRTLNDSFVILDEAQNTTSEQMKMFLTRMGFGSKMVVTGDITQVDLPRARVRPRGVGDILADVEGIEFVRFGGDDVVRHPLVQRIVAAYDEPTRPGARAAPAGSAANRGGLRSRSSRSGMSCPSRPGLPRLHRSPFLDRQGRCRHLAVAFVAARAPRRGHRLPPRQGRPRPTSSPSRHLTARRADSGRRARARRREICPVHTVALARGGCPGCFTWSGIDHETDAGEMLALQARDPSSWIRCAPARASSRSRGGPNVGKSTLVIAIVGRKVAIVSDKPQTTRRAIRGVATRDDVQLVLDRPPRRQAPARRAHARGCSAGSSPSWPRPTPPCSCVNGDQGVGGPGDRFIADRSRRAGVPVVIAVNKVDRLEHRSTVAALQAAADLGLDAEIFPVSARTGQGVQALVDHLVCAAAREPVLLPARGGLRPARGRHARRARPRAGPRAAPARRSRTRSRCRSRRSRSRRRDRASRALPWVETESQKGILIGRGGRMIKAIGTAARRELERELGAPVHLDLSVRVRRSWRADDALLDRLGIT